jgi:DNA-binding IclR family transcriptional regulator
MVEHRSSTNSIQKVCATLRALAHDGPLRLTEVATLAQLNKATTYRILEGLIKEGFAQRTEDGRRFVAGPESLALAAALDRSPDLRDLARPGMMRMAQASEDTVLLSIRSGAEAVCIERQIGTFPIRANYLDVGSRRPLGVGAGSTALLAWLPEREIEVLLEIVQTRLAAYPRHSIAAIHADLGRARERGYALVLDTVIERMGGIGLPIRRSDGTVVGAFSIAALSERIRGREASLAALMRAESEHISRELG